MLGVDPGASGAIAVLRPGELPVVMDMPVGKITVGKTERDRISPQMLAVALWDQLPVDVAYVEEVTAMPRQGVSSVFTFGQAHGMVLGALAQIGVRIVRIRPQVWQATVSARGDPRVRALELYPGLSKALIRKKDEGRADAVLIAHAGLILEGKTK